MSADDAIKIPPMRKTWKDIQKTMMDYKLVTFGCFVTVGVLIGGVTSFKMGVDKKVQNAWMRARVYSQAATLFSLIGYEFGIIGDVHKRKSPPNAPTTENDRETV